MPPLPCSRCFRASTPDTCPEGCSRRAGLKPFVAQALGFFGLRGSKYPCSGRSMDMTPYRLALLQWTLPVVSYSSAGILRKRFAAYSAGLLVRDIMASEGIT